jgi:lambda family phage portal protein
LNFYQQQELAFRSELDSGDVFVLLPFIRRPMSVYALKVQLVEADRVCNPDGKKDTEMLCGGVERDSVGAPAAYHILQQHPHGLTLTARKWQRVPAYGSSTGRRNVIHLFDKRRPGQTRGYPYLSPVIESLRGLGNYSEAELTAAVVSSFFTVFIKSPGGMGIGLDSSGTAPTSTPKSGDTVSLGAGALVDLAPGEEISTANPGRPNTAFDPFVQAVLRQIGVALELPFELLIKHFTSSYTAARGALLEAWRFFRKRREHLGERFCQPIYEAWLEEAVALGRIDAPGFFDDPSIRAAWCGTAWHGDSAGQIDPLKEAQAAQVRLDTMLTTHARETAEITGEDWEDVIERRAWERDIMKDLDLRPEPAKVLAPAPANDGPAPGSGDPATPDPEDAED